MKVQQKFWFRDKFRPVLVLLIIAILAYWQMVWLQYSLKWDAIDVVLPFRYFAAECYGHGIFPLWNPYQFTGFPVHADLQSPTWYPEVILTGLFFPYTNYTLHFWLTLHIFLAGYGMFRLLRHFEIRSQTAVFTGIAYMLSGFIAGHGQAIFAIIAAAWLPFMLLFYLQTAKQLQWKPAIWFCIIAFLIITGGYQAITIILLYLLIAVFIFYSAKYIKNKQRKQLKKWLLLNGFMLATILIMSSIIWVPVLQAMPHTARFGGVSLRGALSHPFSPSSFLSLLFPFATVKEPVKGFFNNDISMRNAFFGSIMLIFFIASFFRKKSKFEWLLIAFSVFALLASLGSFLPVREWIYTYFPLMNMFRFSAYFSLFFVFPFLLLAGVSLNRFIDNPQSSRKTIVVIGSVFLLVYIVAIVIALRNSSLQEIRLNSKFWQEQSNVFQHLLLNSIIQFIIIASFLVVVVLRRRKGHLYTAIGFFIAIEMVISVQLIMPFTVVSEHNPAEIRTTLKELPRGFPIPLAHDTIAENTDVSFARTPLWRNTNIYKKTIGIEGFSSFKLKNYELLFDSLPALKQATLQHQLLYFAEKIQPNSALTSSEVIAKNTVFSDVLTEQITVSGNNETSIEFTDFSPNRIEALVSTQKKAPLVLLQSWYPGWEVAIDDEEANLWRANINYMGTIIPPGKHTVVFRYSNPLMYVAFAVSYAVLLSLLVWLFFRTFLPEQKNKKHWLIAVLSLLAVLTLIAVLSIFFNRQQHNGKDYAAVSSLSEKRSWETHVKSCNTFEEVEQKYWSSAQCDSSKAKSGQWAQQLTENKEFSSTFEYNLPIASTALRIVSHCDIWSSDSLQAQMVCEINRQGESQFWAGKNWQTTVVNEWQHTENQFEIEQRLQAGDKIKVYIWNEKNEQFFCDNFCVEIYQLSEK